MGQQRRLLLLGRDLQREADPWMVQLDPRQATHPGRPMMGLTKMGAVLPIHKEMVDMRAQAVVDMGAQEEARPIHHKRPQDRDRIPRMRDDSMSLRHIYTPTPPRSRCSPTC